MFVFIINPFQAIIVSYCGSPEYSCHSSQPPLLHCLQVVPKLFVLTPSFTAVQKNSIDMTFKCHLSDIHCK